MCGRFYLAESDACEELTRIIQSINRKKPPTSMKTAGEIFPSDVVPVLANSRQNDVQPFAMRWGYSFPNSRPVINARSETASVKPMFKDGMKQRRCLIPATYYYEWEHMAAQRTKYAIRPIDAEMLYLAGIYHLEKHQDVIVPAFTILTRAAAPDIQFIHDRMPIILPRDILTEWLDPSNQAEEILANAAMNMEFLSC